MAREGGGNGGVTLGEIVASLSLATDLGMGQPMEHGLRTCLIAGGLAEALGLDEKDRADTYYLCLLRWIGCSAHAQELAQLFGDDIATHERAATIDFGRRLEVLVDLLRHAGENRSPLARGPGGGRAKGGAEGSARPVLGELRGGDLTRRRARCGSRSAGRARWLLPLSRRTLGSSGSGLS